SMDIFVTDVVVTSNKAIFVGRDRLIDRLSTGASNYALYGGRRIGKSSILVSVKEKLERRQDHVIYHSFEGSEDHTDLAVANRLLMKLHINTPVQRIDDFKQLLQEFLETKKDERIWFLFDEIDNYITANRHKHLLIEVFRTLANLYGHFRVIVAGFMALYDCMEGRGPYTPISDPWPRMFKKEHIGNLRPENAEQIVREGFLNVMGWTFKSRSIPQRVVEYTGGHPAFVQDFCRHIHLNVGQREDRSITLDDLEAIFRDDD